MAHFIGKIDFNSLVNVQIADVEYDDEIKKCICIPIKDNDITQWKDEWQLWFRAFGYHEPQGRFTHFLMKFIPRSAIVKMSQQQLEKLARHRIGSMVKSTYATETDDKKQAQQ